MKMVKLKIVFNWFPNLIWELGKGCVPKNYIKETTHKEEGIE